MGIFNINYTGLVFALIIIFILLVSAVYYIRKNVNIIPVLWKSIKTVLDYYYIILVPIPIFYLLYFYIFFNDKLPDTHVFNNKSLIYQFKDLSVIFFTTGVVAAASKYMGNMVYFKEKFKKIVMSSEFDQILGKKLEILAYSDETLSKLSNLDEVWKKVTLCKYNKSFPQLMNKINGKLQNEFFFENNLSYYYKNLRIQTSFKLLNNSFIQILEHKTYTVVTNNTEKVHIKFSLSSPTKEDDDNFIKLLGQQTKINGVCFSDIAHDDCIETIKKDGIYIKSYSHILEGSTEYEIEKVIEFRQNLKNDKLYSFNSSKIIDDIYVSLSVDKKLEITFSPIGNIMFSKEKNGIVNDNINYSCRDILMPSEIFKIFISEKNNKL